MRDRIEALIDKVDIISLVGGVVKLGRGRNPRGKCPFHGSNSDSFEVRAEPKNGRPHAHCWGCGWHGDAIKFVCDWRGVDFMAALADLEAQNGLDGAAAPAVRREKRAAPVKGGRTRELVDSATMGRWLWDHGLPEYDAIRTYLRGRGIGEDVLPEVRLAPSLRFVARAPIVPWAIGADPASVPHAPAMVAMVRRRDDTGGIWRPIGLHVTFLAPDLASKMVRQRRDGTFYPERKMLGEVQGGAVLLGRIIAGEPLYVGEGIETVLSGIDLAKAPWKACGLAALSLDNLSGHPVRTRAGALPLYDIRPDPERTAGLAFAHDGPVIGLIDADMKPLRGPRGAGELVIERRGGPTIRRAISTAERATISAELLVRNWRRAGCRRVTASRPPMGMDFNDLGRVA